MARIYIYFAQANIRVMRHFIENIKLESLPKECIIIGEDLALIPLSDTFSIKGEPILKLSHAIITVISAGNCHIKINLEEHDIESPSLLTLLPGQIIEPMGKSPNFEGYAIALSKRFIDTINLPGWQQHYMSMYNNPIGILDSDRLESMRFFYTILYRAAENKDNPFRLQVIENLIRVFYYGGLVKLDPAESKEPTTRNAIVKHFIELVHEHYRTERQIGFYADLLCITPKYLSKLVKENTGRSAGEWIERHVILEARALLQSSDMTIQQIAASLNFPNQSFFGKYFKRATGLSPKQYKREK